MSLSAVTHGAHCSDWVHAILNPSLRKSTDRKDRSELAKTRDPITNDELFCESPISGQSMKKRTS